MKFTPKFDIGYGLHVPEGFDRLVDNNGEFNVVHTKRPIQFRDVYHYLINTSWTHFLLWVLLGYFVVSFLFAFIYLGIGIDELQGIKPGSFIDNLLHSFYFSTQTFSTVGYGFIAPTGHWASITASIEALIGLLFFSFGTGLLYGRFSRAKPNLKFSDHIYHRDFRDGKALMFRLMHKHPNVLMDMEAEVYLLQKFQSEKGQELKYSPLELERTKLSIMPLTWTIVIIIDDKNPLYNWTEEEFKKNKGEFIVMIKYFDETFSQTIYQRFSFLFEEIIFDKQFAPAHTYNQKGTAYLDHEKLDETL
jgi:inward rectifier potassium channel